MYCFFLAFPGDFRDECFRASHDHACSIPEQIAKPGRVQHPLKVVLPALARRCADKEKPAAGMI
jgi:hypothetical protein